jgi:nitrogen fixation protein NifU and related proteins
MSDLRELYQQTILDHQKKPRNFRAMPDATGYLEGHNPLCGDRLTLFLKLEGDTVKDVSFQGEGCAISKSSASMMTEGIKGKKLADVRALFRQFHELVTGQPAAVENPDEPKPPLGKLAVFSGVREFPVRVKCATLAWHTLMALVNGREDQVVSTE